jgi:hypothetical protein
MDYDIENLHKAAMVFLKNKENSRQYIDSISFSTYVKEFRTITLGVPRQSGKTKYMLALKDKVSSVMFVHSQAMADYCCRSGHVVDRSNIITFEEMFSVARFNRGRRLGGLKYSVFLVDEYSFAKKEHDNNFAELLTELKTQNIFAEDFYVLKIGTPTF